MRNRQNVTEYWFTFDQHSLVLLFVFERLKEEGRISLSICFYILCVRGGRYLNAVQSHNKTTTKSTISSLNNNPRTEAIINLHIIPTLLLYKAGGKSAKYHFQPTWWNQLNYQVGPRMPIYDWLSLKPGISPVGATSLRGGWPTTKPLDNTFEQLTFCIWCFLRDVSRWTY